MKIAIKHRWTDDTLYEADIPDETPSGLQMRVALEKATAARANLVGAYLADAYLAGAYLVGASLVGADLTGANLVGAYLVRASLVGANLADADLVGANLVGASLARAYLVGVNLVGADLVGANLVDANGAELAIARTRILPDGDLIGWKKCSGDVIVKLRIPADAKRSHAFGRKCRAEFADVLEVLGAEVGIAMHDNETKYRVGQRVTPDRFDENWQEECAPGLHFFITREEAEAY